MALSFACQNGHVNVIRELLKDDRVDPSANQNAALILACRNGRRDAVEELLKDQRVNPQDQEHRALKVATENGHFHVRTLLLAHPKSDSSTNVKKIRRQPTHAND